MNGDAWIDVPDNLTLEAVQTEFGYHAVEFYRRRIEDRMANGKIYLNPIKTIFLWAAQDRMTNQGFFSSYRGYSRRGKSKNFGRS